VLDIRKIVLEAVYCALNIGGKVFSQKLWYGCVRLQKTTLQAHKGGETGKFPKAFRLSGK
jgi:hypothetical protein